MPLHSLMFGWEYPPKHSGGLGVACKGLVRGLLHHGVRVTLVLPIPVASDAEGLGMLHPTTDLFEELGVPSVLQPYDTQQLYAARVSSMPHALAELYGPDLGSAVERYANASVELTKHVHPDVIHCHDWMTFEAATRAADHHNVPMVAHVHATELDRTHFRPNESIARRERSGLRRADKVIAVSRYTKSILVDHYGIPADRVSVVHNGHDPHAGTVPTIFSQAGRTKRPLVLFLGRLTIQKNPLQFLNVAKRVRQLKPNVQFVMAGDGPMLPELVDRACGMGLGDSMVFTGKVSNTEALTLYASADCFVMPSLSEPFGLVALEAVAHGTPVIVSKQSGVAEVLDHAFKVDFWDTDKMADCIVTILREKPLAAQLRAEAPAMIRKLSWINQASKIESLYRDLRKT